MLRRLHPHQPAAFAFTPANPHFHILGLDGREAQVRLADLVVLKGKVERRALKEALDWAAKNGGFLQETWNDCQSR